MFSGFLLCQGVFEIGKKSGAEYQVWTTLLQGSWVVPIIRYVPQKLENYQLKSYLIIRDEVIWIHDELFKFFKALKDLKQQRPKGEKQQAGKKAKEAEALFMKALQLAPAFHRGRRIYLAGLLEQQVKLLGGKLGLDSTKFLLFFPDFTVQKHPRADGAEDAAPAAAPFAVQVRGRLGGPASEQHAGEEAGPGPRCECCALRFWIIDPIPVHIGRVLCRTRTCGA